MAKNFVEQITIKAVAEGFDKINQQIEKVEKSAAGLSKKLESAGRALTIGVTAPLTAFAGFALKEFAQAEKAIAKVESALKLTGDRIGITFDELQKASQNLQNNSIFGDDEILGKVSSQLLRVGGLTKDSFLEAQQAVIDLASALDTDLQSATLQVAKALESPADALGALGRIGIRFSEDEQKLIKSLVDAGRAAEAQGIILDKLRSKFDGTGKAISETSFGSLVQLKNAFGDLAEVIGGRLFSAISPFVEKLTTIFQNLQQVNPQVLDFSIKLGLVAASLGPVSIALGLLVANITLLVNPITVGIGLIVAITSSLDALAKRFTIVSRIIAAVNTILFTLLTALSGLATALVTIVSLFLKADAAIAKLLGLERVSKFADETSKALYGLSDDIAEITGNLAGTTGQEFSKIFSGETAEVLSVNDLFGDFNNFINDITAKGQETGVKFGEGIKTGISTVSPFAVSAALAADKLDQELNRVRDQYNQLTETGEIFTNSFTNALSSIQAGTKSLGDSFKDLEKTIVNSLFNAAIQNAFTKLFQNLGGAFTFGGVTSGGPNITGQTFADGGSVRGPGTGTSDSILARLSNGEFVMSAKAVKAFGVQTLHKMNALGKGFMPKSRFGMPAFAEGGSVNGGGGVSVNVINNSSQPVNARANTRFDGRQLIIDTFLEDARVNGPMSQTMQNTYGVRR
jgi:hypothetical protein